MARGRKAKTGRRTKSGRLSRATARIDRGNDRTALAQALYGTNGSDAIGRAYERGLFGAGQDAKTMLDTARAMHRAYWAWYANGPTRCALADRTGASIREDGERERRQEQWLNEMLAIAGRSGHSGRVLFDQLVIDIHPDQGPPWLDRIIAKQPTPDDWARLNRVLSILAECAGVQRIAKRA